MFKTKEACLKWMKIKEIVHTHLEKQGCSFKNQWTSFKSIQNQETSLRTKENAWKSMKIIQNEGNPKKIFENQWKSIKIIENVQNHENRLKIKDNQGKPMKIHKNHWNASKIQQIPGISWEKSNKRH
jgi:hypothetical protein